jgi:hypothetical protein
MDKILFLDIDGVLNVIPQGHDKYGGIFHKHFEDNLYLIVELTGAKIVISSSWRHSGLEEMQAMWKDRKLPGEVVGITPDEQDVVHASRCEFYDQVCRGHEIQLYIDTHKIEKYCIIDDDKDMLAQQYANFVHTANNSDHADCIDIGYGLTHKCAMKAIEILNK